MGRHSASGCGVYNFRIECILIKRMICSYLALFATAASLSFFPSLSLSLALPLFFAYANNER